MRRTILAALIATFVLPASAHAAFFPSEVIDGPNGDIKSVGDVDLSRDGTGGVVYVRDDGGVPHVFFSAFQDGAFGPVQRLDAALPGPSSQPVIAASNNNRLAVAFVNDGMLYASVKGKEAAGFSPPALVATGGVSNPSIDMSINGATYVTFTVNGDVLAARAERDSPAFSVLPAPLDVNPGANAGNGPEKRSRVVVSADGTALAVWGEDGADNRIHVMARRMFEQRLSVAPQDLTVDQVDGVGTGSATVPEVDIEDDSSYAQVVFRQDTAAGPRTLMRRLVGSTFDNPVAIDGGTGSLGGHVDLNGRGEGLYGVNVGGGVLGGIIFNNKLNGVLGLAGGNAVESRAVAALGDNEDGAVAWFAGTGEADTTVRGRYFDGVEKLQVEPEAVLARPEFGPAYVKGGLDSATSRAGDVVVVFLQGGAADRRLVAAIYDKPPSRIAGSNTTKVRKFTRFAWGTSLNLLGAPTYRIVLDGKLLGETQDNQLVVQPGQVPDGTHRWQIFIRDRRGQEVVSRTRQLRVDNTPPTLTVSLKKKKRTVTLTARGGDPNGKQPSGLSRVLVDWGDGKLVRMGTKASRTYPSLGRKTIRVKAVDKAGNELVVERSTRIGGK